MSSETVPYRVVARPVKGFRRRFPGNRSDYVFVLLGGQEGARPLLIVCGGLALNKFKAGDLVKEAALILQGGGGGRPEMASGQVKTKDGFVSFADSVRSRL